MPHTHSTHSTRPSALKLGALGALGTLCLALTCAPSRAAPAGGEVPFEGLRLSLAHVGPSAASQAGPTRWTFEVEAGGQARFLRSHPLLRFPACAGRASRAELERLALLLPAAGCAPEATLGPEPEPRAGSRTFVLEWQRAGSPLRLRGAEDDAEARGLRPLFSALEGLARRLLATHAEPATRLRGRVEVRPLGGRFEVLLATPRGEVRIAGALAAALRPLQGHPVELVGALEEGGELSYGRLVDPTPVLLAGQALRLKEGPGLRTGSGPVLRAVGLRSSALAEAEGHRVRVAGWRFASGRLLIDSVGAEAARATEAERRAQVVASHAAGAGLRVLRVDLAHGRALVQDTRGGRIGWVPKGHLRWSARVELQGPEGSPGVAGASWRVRELERP